MDPRLLAGADAYRLAFFHKTNGIRLGILQRDQRDEQVPLAFRGYRLIRGGDIRQQFFPQDDIVAPLLKFHPEYRFAFNILRFIRRVDLDDGVAAFALAFQYRQLRRRSRGR